LALNKCDENVIVAAELQVKINDQLAELSAGKTLHYNFF
jgi:hypothetical protein